MPNRFVCVAILAVWAYATMALLQRDVLPGLLIGPPPDLRVVARANDELTPTRWAILVADDPDALNLRSVGQAETYMRRAKDDWTRLHSSAWFDSRELLKGTPFETPQGERVEINAAFDIDNRGNLEGFRAGVSFEGLDEEVLVLTGVVRRNQLDVTSRGPSPLLNWKRSFPYEPREMVQSVLAPMDHLPNLQVGQRWSSRVVNPLALTGQVRPVEVVVERKSLITWDSSPVTTFEVVSRFGPMTARTWVRASDGLVLRQEAPLPFVRIVLDRLPERYIGPGATIKKDSER